MSESYGEGPASSGSEQPSGTVETAKHEAEQVKDTATKEAGHVADTAKTEAKSVAHEAKSQVKELYAQSSSELKEQAGIQQRRVSEGLRAVGGELKSMADNAEDGGIGADLVRQTSLKVSSAAEWIGDRDPGSLLSEVKSYARRKPGTFIAAAGLVGLVAGRLTRALAEGAADDGSSAAGDLSGKDAASGQSNTSTPPDTATRVAPPAPVVQPQAIPSGGAPGTNPSAGTGLPPADGAGTPVFDQADAAVRDSL